MHLNLTLSALPSAYLVNALNWTGGAGSFVKKYISILCFTRSGTVIDLYHMGFVVFLENVIDFVVAFLSCSQNLSFNNEYSLQKPQSIQRQQQQKWQKNYLAIRLSARDF